MFRTQFQDGPHTKGGFAPVGSVYPQKGGGTAQRSEAQSTLEIRKVLNVHRNACRNYTALVKKHLRHPNYKTYGKMHRVRKQMGKLNKISQFWFVVVI